LFISSFEAPKLSRDLSRDFRGASSSPAQARQSCSRRQTKSRAVANRRASGTLGARIARGKISRLYDVSENHNPPRLSLKTGRIPISHQRSDARHPMGVIRTPRHVVSSGTCVIQLPAVSEGPYLPCLPDTKLVRGFISACPHVFDRGEYHVAGRCARSRTKFLAHFLSSGYFAPSGSSKARSSVWGCVVYFLSAPTRLACKAAGRTRAKIWCEMPRFGIAPGGDFRPKFRPVVSAEWRG
jgi:hypothetical protein